MLPILYSKPKPARDQTWLVMHSRQFDSSLFTHGRVVFYDAPPDEATLGRIEHAHVWAPPLDPLQELPSLIARLPSLVQLSIGPGQIASTVAVDLRADMLPGGLRHLSISAGQRAFTWRAGPMPQLESLSVDAPMRFTPEDFPALLSLSMAPDRKGANLEPALRMPLQELNLYNVPFDAALFDRLAGLPLVALGLMAGRSLKTLSGIEQLSGLRSLRLKNQGLLETIGPIAALPALEWLDIQYCKRIVDIAVLGQLPVLQELTLVGCGDVGLGSLAQTLRARLRRENIAATT